MKIFEKNVKCVRNSFTKIQKRRCLNLDEKQKNNEALQFANRKNENKKNCMHKLRPSLKFHGQIGTPHYQNDYQIELLQHISIKSG